MSKPYLDFIKENKDTVFTVIKDGKMMGFDTYTFKEDNRFLFFAGDLIRVNKNKK